jgi:hypothetical protein
LWSAWSARRKEILEDIFKSHLSIFGFITSYYLTELSITHTVKPKRSTVNEAPANAIWLAPPRGFVKVNVDAAVSKHGYRGVVAAVCRDETGALLGASVLAVPGISVPATL